MDREFMVFAGSANPGLARETAAALGSPVGCSHVERFPDGEVSVRILETVRRKEIFIVQPTAPPVDENLVELLCFADAARRAAADRVTAVIPYFGYARSDKRHGRREPVTARMVGDVLQAAGIDHVITLDLHAPQIEGFFSVPVDVLTAVPLLAEALAGGVDAGWSRHRADAPAGEHPAAAVDPDCDVIVAPDEGRVRMATDYAQRLGLPLVIVHKRRESGTATAVAQIVGDVEGKRCIIIDDMIATGGTLVTTIAALRAAGATPEITIAATHGLLLPGAREMLNRDDVARILVTNTIAVPHADWHRLRVLSVAPVIAAAVHAFVADGSLRPLYGARPTTADDGTQATGGSAESHTGGPGEVPG